MNEFLENEEFRLPTNIKQIGEIQEGIQIYLEDYVHTYLYQYARQDSRNERLAILTGRYERKEGEEILLISGAIQVKHTVIEKGQPYFTGEAWDDVVKKQKQFFPGDQILGWVHTQPGYGLMLTSFHQEQHEIWFGKPYQIIYIIDPIAKEGQFYAWQDEPVPVPGYFIYYARNEKMHEYMMEYRVIKSKMLERPEEDIIIQYRRQERNRKQEAQQKKIIHMLSSFSAVLLLVCLVMGIGLVYNLEQIQRLQQALDMMDDTYSNLFTQVKTGGVESVFAQEVEIPRDETPILVTVEEPEAGQEFPQVVEKEDNSEGKELDAEEKSEVTPVSQNEAPVEVVAQDTTTVASTQQVVSNQEEIKPEEPKIPEKYQIQAGDNLSNISYRFYQTTDMIEEILKINNLTDPDKIYAGKTILLP
ncbi:MAG: LysM peptidoglycan-binding domain-containing protein [Epulopiscium sp.]|nr:LysM peptidoglycan-binding domain-containing protein [Candidatus Epulonipiscium sp.]